MKKNILIWVMMLCMLMLGVTAQHYPSSVTVTNGNLLSGDVSCLTVIDVPCLEVQPDVTGFTIELTYENVIDFGQVVAQYSHTGGGGVGTGRIEFYDFVNDLWQPVLLIPITDSTENVNHLIEEDVNYINVTTVKSRIIKDDGGNPSHRINLHYNALFDIDEVQNFCPTTDLQNKNSLLVLLFIVVILAFALITKTSMIGVFGGLALLIYSTTIYSCNTIVGMIGIVCGILIMIYFFFGQTD